MADMARGAVSVTPVITKAVTSDADAIDVIHHDIKKALGGKLEYTIVNANDRYYYKTNVDVSSDANLITTGSGSHQFTSLAENIATGDVVKFLFINNSGTSDGTTANAQNVYLTLDGGDPGSSNDALTIGSGESFICKPKAVTADNLHAEAASGTVRCTVMAILDNSSGSD